MSNTSKRSTNPLYRNVSARDRIVVAGNILAAEIAGGVDPLGRVMIAGEKVSPWGAVLWLTGEWDECLDPTPQQFIDRLTILRPGNTEAPGYEAFLDRLHREFMDWRLLSLTYVRSRRFDREVIAHLSNLFGVRRDDIMAHSASLRQN